MADRNSSMSVRAKRVSRTIRWWSQTSIESHIHQWIRYFHSGVIRILFSEETKKKMKISLKALIRECSKKKILLCFTDVVLRSNQYWRVDGDTIRESKERRKFVMYLLLARSKQRQFWNTRSSWSVETIFKLTTNSSSRDVNLWVWEIEAAYHENERKKKKDFPKFFLGKNWFGLGIIYSRWLQL